MRRAGWWWAAWDGICGIFHGGQATNATTDGARVWLACVCDYRQLVADGGRRGRLHLRHRFVDERRQRPFQPPAAGVLRRVQRAGRGAQFPHLRRVLRCPGGRNARVCARVARHEQLDQLLRGGGAVRRARAHKFPSPGPDFKTIVQTTAVLLCCTALLRRLSHATLLRTRPSRGVHSMRPAHTGTGRRR